MLKFFYSVHQVNLLQVLNSQVLGLLLELVEVFRKELVMLPTLMPC